MMQLLQSCSVVSLLSYRAWKFTCGIDKHFYANYFNGEEEHAWDQIFYIVILLRNILNIHYGSNAVNRTVQHNRHYGSNVVNRTVQHNIHYGSNVVNRTVQHNIHYGSRCVKIPLQ